MSAEPAKKATPEQLHSIYIKLALWSFAGLLVGFSPFLALRGEYGSVLFFSIPFSLGLVIALLQSFTRKKSIGSILLYSFLVALVVLIGFLIVAKEGFICVLMATPVVLVPYIIGMAIGYFVQNHLWSKYVGMVVILLLNCSAYVYDAKTSGFDSLRIDDSILIPATPEVVWNQLTGPFTFGNADDFFLSNGVSYPQFMQLQQSNNCASLYCRYSNGAMTATIDSLVPHQLMRFSFHEAPVSMKETSLYADVEPKHIRGRILLTYGAFRIIQKSETTVELRATTVFRNSIGPRYYWNWWATYLLHKVHQHVLEQIKEKCSK